MLWNVQSVHQLTYTKTEGRKISQHYICVDCSLQFINFYDSQGYPEKLNANEDHIVSKTYMTRVEGANSCFRPIVSSFPSPKYYSDNEPFVFPQNWL